MLSVNATMWFVEPSVCSVNVIFWDNNLDNCTIYESNLFGVFDFHMGIILILCLQAFSALSILELIFRLSFKVLLSELAWYQGSFFEVGASYNYP